MLMKLLPALLFIAWLWWTLTANTRTEKRLRGMSKPLTDWQLLEVIQRFSKELETKPFDVKVLDLEPVNAVALASGEVYLWRGLHDKYLSGEVSKEEVAAVIAHEIGHVALGHARRRVVTGRAQIAVLALIGLVAGRLLFGWWTLLAALGLSIANAQSSQKDEFEADAFAAQLMMRSGMDPNASIAMLRKVERWGGPVQDQPAPLRWMASHPPIDERVASLQRVIAAGAPTAIADAS
ncbi:MAG: M48 family metalloprotease [Pseudomonadota bacterium]